MSAMMSTIDQTGAVEAEDILVNALRAIKGYPIQKTKEIVSCQIPLKNDKTPDDPEEARKLGHEEGLIEGKKAGYLEALQHMGIFIKALNV